MVNYPAARLRRDTEKQGKKIYPIFEFSDLPFPSVLLETHLGGSAHGNWKGKGAPVAVGHLICHYSSTDSYCFMPPIVLMSPSCWLSSISEGRLFCRFVERLSGDS